MRQALLLMAILLQAAAMCAQDIDKNIRTRATMLGIGYRNTLDTYFTPYNYDGLEVRLLQERERAISPLIFPKKMKHQWTRTATLSIDFDFCSSHSGESDIMGALIQYEMSWLLPLNLDGRLQLSLGPAWSSHLGFAYNTLGGNNPAQAYAATNLGVEALATYTLNPRLALRCKATMPIIGLMFSPNYTQSYYEIFSLGDYDHNICLTSPLSAFSGRATLTLDWKLRRSTLRAGYMIEIRQSRPNNLRRHDWSHLFIIGYVKRFKLLPP